MRPIRTHSGVAVVQIVCAVSVRVEQSHPGSAGCIDLTDQMDGFADWFKKNGKDLILYVTY